MAQAEHNLDPPAHERDASPDYGWTLLVGGIVGLTIVKEMFGRVRRNPVTVRARSVSRGDAAFSIAVLLKMLGWIGARVLGIRATSS